MSNPEAFTRRVLGGEDGRFAYLYGSIDQLDPARQRFALGLTLSDAGARVDRLRALQRAFLRIDPEWSQSALPFARPRFDPATILQTALVTPEGLLAAPAQRRLWQVALAGDALPDDPAGLLAGMAADDLADAADLVAMIALGPARTRRGRFETFALGQRVFADVPLPMAGDLLVGLRGHARFPALMLVAERLGIRDPRVFAALARHALAIERVGSSARQISLMSQFQGVLAVLDRLSRTGTLTDPAVPMLAASLAAIPVDRAGGYRGRIAEWLEGSLRGALPGSGDERLDSGFERQLLDAFADAESESGRHFEWEDIGYVVSVTGADRRRIEALRAKQGGNSLDAVLAFHRDIRLLSDPELRVERVRTLAAGLKTSAARLRPARPWPGMNRGDAPDLSRLVDDAAGDLVRIARPQDIDRASRAAERLIAAADYLLGEVLVALAYVPALGDPGDLVGGEADIAHSHDFGVMKGLTAEQQRRVPWSRGRLEPGSMVAGSVLGVDLALASNALRRLASDRMPAAPRLNLNDRETFSVSVALSNPRRLTDALLAAVAAALRSGRARVAAAGADPAALEALARGAGMSPVRRELLTWAAAHGPAGAADLFSEAEVFTLGWNGSRDRLDAFGLSSEPLGGCYCLRFPSPGAWESYAGRAATGQLATRVPDLTLRVVEFLDELGVPAPILPGVLALAVQDFVDEVPAIHLDDWPAAAAHARRLTRERVEDYISALAADGPLQRGMRTQ